MNAATVRQLRDDLRGSIIGGRTSPPPFTTIIEALDQFAQLLDAQRVMPAVVSPTVQTGTPPDRDAERRRATSLSDVRDRKLAMLHTVALMAAQLEAGDRANARGYVDKDGAPDGQILPASHYVTRAVQITTEVERQIGRL
jgi:hypothetical protein